MIDGEWKVKDGQSLIYDEKEILTDGKQELQKLFKRI
jgi:hypothetical protein